MNRENKSESRKSEHESNPVEQTYYEWDKALSTNNPDALLALYAPDAVLESPLIPYLMGSNEGICRGHDQLRQLFEKVAERKPKIRQYFRTGYMTDGKKMMWEYPREAPDNDQMDFVEVKNSTKRGLFRNTAYIGAGSDLKYYKKMLIIGKLDNADFNLDML